MRLNKQEKGVESSMTDADHCAQNALAERMNGIFKQEFIPTEGYLSFNSAKSNLTSSINLYNVVRPHMALAMLTPVQVHKGFYDSNGKRITSTKGSSRSTTEIIESLLSNNPLFMKIKQQALA